MNARRRLPTAFVSWLTCFLAGTGFAAAQQACFPHCDYTHYYGPFDFSYIRPGLIGFPACGPQGDCAPYLAYNPVSGGRITVRLLRAMPAHP